MTRLLYKNNELLLPIVLTWHRVDIGTSSVTLSSMIQQALLVSSARTGLHHTALPRNHRQVQVPPYPRQ